jgi:4-aminobutyrate aminotransferase
MNKKELLEMNQDYIYPAIANYYSEPLVLASGEGNYVRDIDGKEYLDFFTGILTVSVGHCNPTVTAKTIDQLKTIQHTSTLYLNEPMLAFARKLAQTAPGNLNKCFFTNSGTEANETAILSAMLHTGEREVIALRHSYHGRSLLAMSASGHHNWRLGGTHISGLKHAHNGYCYRCALGLIYPACDLKCARDIEELIRTETSGKIAAFIGEPIQGVGGFVTPPKEYFKVVYDIIKKYGGIFISDEVQTGFGRTGGVWWGIENYGVQPDIITCAKGIANGAPMGATVATDAIAESVKGMTISTFGGNPVTSTAALATVEYMEENNLAANAKTVGDYLGEKLKSLADKYAIIGDVRGMGLMRAVELAHPDKQPASDDAVRLMDITRDNGLLIGKAGLYGNVLRVAPALNITKTEVDDAISILDKSFNSITG